MKEFVHGRTATIAISAVSSNVTITAFRFLRVMVLVKLHYLWTFCLSVKGAVALPIRSLLFIHLSCIATVTSRRNFILRLSSHPITTSRLLALSSSCKLGPSKTKVLLIKVVYYVPTATLIVMYRYCTPVLKILFVSLCLYFWINIQFKELICIAVDQGPQKGWCVLWFLDKHLEYMKQ